MSSETKKKPIGKIIIGVVAVLIVIGVIGNMAGGSTGGSASNPDSSTTVSTSDSTSTNTNESTATTSDSKEAPAEEKSEPAKEKYTIADETLDTSNQFAAAITGTLTNNTDKDVSYIQIEYVLYDESGAQVGTGFANTNNLKAGGSWKFEAYTTAKPEEVAKYERVKVTGF